ncbi:MAG: ATP-binding protein [Candidatus Delongbacteria bacterium]
MPPRLKAYLWIVILLGLGAGGLDLRLLAQESIPLAGWLERLVWFGLLLGVSHFPIVSRSGGAVSTLNSALNYCLLLSFGAPFAGPAVALNSVYLNFIRRRAIWYKVLFNAAQMLLAVNLAHLLFRWAGGQTGQTPALDLPLSYLQLVLPFVGVVSANLLLVSLAVRLERGTPLGQQMRASHYFDLGGNTILLYLGAQLFYLKIELGWLGVALATVPLVWVHTYLRRYNELKLVHARLDESNQSLRERGEELERGNRVLEDLNRNLGSQGDRLRAQTQELEAANQQLQQMNEDLQHTRRTLVRAEKLKTMGQMAGGVAHDFNNILGAIIARSELLQLEELPPAVRDGLASIHRSALDGAAVVRRIQDFSRVREQQDFERLDLNALVEDSLEMTRALWRDGAHRLGLTYEIRRDCPAPVAAWGNAAELREVLHNLILNALDAMPGGGVLSISTRSRETGVELVVTDTGQGMGRDVLEHIFDPFFTTKGPRGNGLGLSVCFGIIERHQGEIRAESEPGRGSAFRITLPAPPADSVAPVPAAPSTRETLQGGRPHTALVVDDEPDVRAVLVDTLRLMGHEVREAASAPEGLEIWREQRPELVFTDLGMPGMNGWEFTDRLRQEAGERQPLVILVTGWGAQIKQEDLQRHAVDRVLPKPFKLKELDRLLRQLDEAAAGEGAVGPTGGGAVGPGGAGF